MKILVVEDEIKLNKGIVEGLQKRNYAVDTAFDGEEGEKLARINNYDLIVMDIMMPKKDGMMVCYNLRVAGNGVPIILLTAKDTIADKVTGLNAGADDYVVKPFAFEELHARIRTLLRRPPLTSKDILELDDLKLDTRCQKLYLKEKEIEITLREYGLIEYLLRNIGNVITRDDLIEHAWDRNYDSLSNVVDVHIKNIRKKLPKNYAKRIKTVWGKGYILN